MKKLVKKYYYNFFEEHSTYFNQDCCYLLGLIRIILHCCRKHSYSTQNLMHQQNYCFRFSCYLLFCEQQLVFILFMQVIQLFSFTKQCYSKLQDQVQINLHCYKRHSCSSLNSQLLLSWLHLQMDWPLFLQVIYQMTNCYCQVN